MIVGIISGNKMKRCAVWLEFGSWLIFVGCIVPSILAILQWLLFVTILMPISQFFCIDINGRLFWKGFLLLEPLCESTLKTSMFRFYDFSVSTMWALNFLLNKVWSCFWSKDALSFNAFAFLESFIKLFKILNLLW